MWLVFHFLRKLSLLFIYIVISCSCIEKCIWRKLSLIMVHCSEFEELEAVPTMAVMDGPLEPSSSTTSNVADVPDDPSFINFFSVCMLPNNELWFIALSWYFTLIQSDSIDIFNMQPFCHSEFYPLLWDRKSTHNLIFFSLWQAKTFVVPTFLCLRLYRTQSQ